MARTPKEDRSTEKTERIVVYLTKAQIERVRRYAVKIGQSDADSVTVRTALIQHLDNLGIE